MQPIYRYWVRPAPEKDEYGVFVVRYTPVRETSYSKTYAQCAYLRLDGEWIDYPPGSDIEAFCTFDGRFINPFVGSEDWRVAVSNVVEHHVKPYFDALIGIEFT